MGKMEGLEANGDREVGESPGDRCQRPNSSWDGPPFMASLRDLCILSLFDTLNKYNVVDGAAVANYDVERHLEFDKVSSYTDLCINACIFMEHFWDADIEADLKDYIRSRDDKTGTWKGQQDWWHLLPRVLCMFANLSSTHETRRSWDVAVFCMHHLHAEMIRWLKKLDPKEPGNRFATTLDFYLRRPRRSDKSTTAKSLEEVCVDTFEVTKENVQEACEIAEACRIQGLKWKTRLFLLLNRNEKLISDLQEIFDHQPRFLKDLVIFSSEEVEDFFEKEKKVLKDIEEWEYYAKIEDSEKEETRQRASS